MVLRYKGLLPGLVLATMAATAVQAQGVVSPDTKPSSQDAGVKDAKPSSVRDGSATLTGGAVNNGNTIPDASKDGASASSPPPNQEKP